MSKQSSLSPSSSATKRADWRALLVPTLLGLFCFLIYNANFRGIGAGDTLPARYLPLILWQKGTLDLSKDARLVARGHPTFSTLLQPTDPESKVSYFEPSAYWMVRTREHQLASLYPVVTPLLVAPLYFPAALWLDAKGWSQPEVGRVAEVMEKVSASLLASLAVVLMYLVLRRDCGRWSLPLALIFALGTNTWMISSQALWQHGTGQLLIALALLIALSEARPWRSALLGAVCVFIAANRPPDALLAGAILFFVLWSRKDQALWHLAGAAVPLAALLYYNLHFIGHLAGGYAIAKDPHTSFHQLNWLGPAGLLVSPTRGLLVFSPFLVFLPVGLMRRFRDKRTQGLAVALSLGVLSQFLVYSQMDWRAGVSWGPRWLTDMLPILMWMLAPAPLVMRPFLRNVFVLMAAVSIAVQIIGAFWYTKTSDDRIFAEGFTSMRGAWDFHNFPFLTELQHAPSWGELLIDARGSIDRIGPAIVDDSARMPKLESGFVIEGWALCGGRTPSQMLALIDGVIIGSSTEFFPRLDVNEAMGTDSPSGWRITADTKGVSPGKHILQLVVRVEPRSDIRIVREQEVMVVAARPFPKVGESSDKPVTASELDVLAERAASLLRENQSEQGYWLTLFTNLLRFKKPEPEMNAYLTALLVDMLAPVAHKRGLDGALELARRHLASQIEANGLVRYHGLPTAPTIGILGCVITPDSDDTALAWRISGLGAADPRMKLMLEELHRYRDSRGLYRTWLAPQKDYQGIDPGRVPNPTDIGIQIHIYLMLRELDPPAAERLLQAIESSYRDEDVWVYYSKAPLIPYLRTAELQQAGCEIPLPVERLALVSEEQKIWSDAASLFVSVSAAPEDEILQRASLNVLGRIGRDDFALLRLSPPLIYHNDMTASVKRYYWSEDFGYALWLRLYEAATANPRAHPNPRP